MVKNSVIEIWKAASFPSNFNHLKWISSSKQESDSTLIKWVTNVCSELLLIYRWNRWRSRALPYLSFTQKLLTGKLQVLLWTRIQHPFMISIFVVSNSIFKFQKKISKILFWLFLIFRLFESDFGSFWEDFEELWSFGSDILIYLFVYCNNSTKITKIWHKLIVRIRKSPFLNQVFRR